MMSANKCIKNMMDFDWWTLIVEKEKKGNIIDERKCITYVGGL